MLFHCLFLIDFFPIFSQFGYPIVPPLCASPSPVTPMTLGGCGRAHASSDTCEVNHPFFGAAADESLPEQLARSEESTEARYRFIRSQTPRAAQRHLKCDGERAPSTHPEGAGPILPPLSTGS
uniref:Secreted protein n=1 Tax=Astyanax mexicanus TaxID=7994 RepID=A0A3B1KC00_ASTMX